VSVGKGSRIAEHLAQLGVGDVRHHFGEVLHQVWWRLGKRHSAAAHRPISKLRRASSGPRRERSTGDGASFGDRVWTRSPPARKVGDKRGCGGSGPRAILRSSRRGSNTGSRDCIKRSGTDVAV